MKKIFLIFIAVIAFGISVNAQDVIILKNGDDIQAIVQEIGENEIKYKKFDNANGPVYTMKKSEIFMIRYPNGSKDVFTDVSTTTPVETNIQDNVSATAENKGNPYKFRMYIGTGSGHSYGLVGTSLEARFNNFGIHAGLGAAGTYMDDIAWSAGVKWYVWKNLYVDTMVGVIGEYYEESYYYNDYYDYYFYDYFRDPIIGASEMFGVNWSWGGNVRFGVNAGVGFAYGFNYDLFTVAYDVGISISFGTK